MSGRYAGMFITVWLQFYYDASWSWPNDVTDGYDTWDKAWTDGFMDCCSEMRMINWILSLVSVIAVNNLAASSRWLLDIHT